MQLLQGLALVLRRRGWGVALHTADYLSVREQASLPNRIHRVPL